MAKIITTDPKKKEKDQPKKITLDQMRKKQWGDRDYVKHPITVEEIKGWTAERKKEQQDRANRNEHPYRETLDRIRKYPKKP